jgi:hypothetical protein
MNYELLNERAQVLIDLIRLTADRYFEPSTNEGQRGLYQVLIGAGLFYLPSGQELYSGFISNEALTRLKKDPLKTKLVQEHSFPRKAGGRYLYELYREKGEKFTKEFFLKLYSTRLGKYNLVTKEENSRLKKYQKINNGCNHGEFLRAIQEIERLSYDAAGIVLQPLNSTEYAKLKKKKTMKKGK